MGSISRISGAHLRKQIPLLLERFRLENVNNHWIKDLSKGNIQKLNIIQAILNKPELLILDEPISGLDLHAQKELFTTIKKLKEQGTTILMTYHDPNILEELVETTLFLKGGSLALDDPFEIGVDQIKLLKVGKIDESIVKQWDEILHMKKSNSKFLIYVRSAHSDIILTRILQYGGSIDTVSTTNLGKK